MSISIKMIKPKAQIVFLFLLITLLSSCDHEYGYTYEVKNETDSEIRVWVITSWDAADSTYYLDPDETEILFVTTHGFEGRNGPYFAEVTSDIDSMLVFKNDTLISQIDYLNSSSWEYIDGLYCTIVSSEEFEN